VKPWLTARLRFLYLLILSQLWAVALATLITLIAALMNMVGGITGPEASQLSMTLFINDFLHLWPFDLLALVALAALWVTSELLAREIFPQEED
jgi:hypothetical protein